MKNILLLLLSLAFVPSAFAASIGWGSAQNVVGDLNEISTNGVSVGAWNLWGFVAAPPVVVVNGVTFAPLSPDGWSSGNNNARRVSNTNPTTSTTGDSGYDSFLGFLAAAAGGPVGNPTETGAIRLDSLVSLVPGHRYEIQLWFNDQKSNGTFPIEDRVMTYGSSDADLTIEGGIVTPGPGLGSLTVSLEADPNNETGPNDTAIGQFVIGTFTADSDPLILLVEGSHPAGGNLRPHLNAMQIRDLDATPPVITPIGHYWDFDTLDPTSASIRLDLYGSLVTTEVGSAEFRNSLYGEPFAGANDSLLSDSTNSNYLVAETYNNSSASALDFGMESFAISYWTYADTESGVRGPSIFDCAANSNGPGIQLGSRSDGTFNLRINDDQGNSVISSSGTVFPDLASPGRDAWAHVVLNVDRSTNLLSIHFDGVPISEGTIDLSGLTGNIVCSQDLQIGIRDNSTPDGGLDDLAIYPGVLSAQQITDLATATTTPLEVLASFEPAGGGIQAISTSFDQGSGEFTVVFTSAIGRTYSVYGGNSLDDISSWPELTISDLAGDGTNLTYSHISGQTRFFYQVRRD